MDLLNKENQREKRQLERVESSDFISSSLLLDSAAPEYNVDAIADPANNAEANIFW